MRFVCFIGLMQKSYAIIIKTKLSKMLVFVCRLEHFKESSRVVFEVFILDLPIFKIKILAGQVAVLPDDLPLSLSEHRDNLSFIFQFFLKIPDPVLIYRVTNPQHRQLMILILNGPL